MLVQSRNLLQRGGMPGLLHRVCAMLFFFVKFWKTGWKRPWEIVYSVFLFEM